jgi:hypothetical protein
MKLVTDKQGEHPVIWEWLNRRVSLPWSSDLRTIGLMREDGTIAASDDIFLPPGAPDR